MPIVKPLVFRSELMDPGNYQVNKTAVGRAYFKSNFPFPAQLDRNEGVIYLKLRATDFQIASITNIGSRRINTLKLEHPNPIKENINGLSGPYIDLITYHGEPAYDDMISIGIGSTVLIKIKMLHEGKPLNNNLLANLQDFNPDRLTTVIDQLITEFPELPYYSSEVFGQIIGPSRGLLRVAKKHLLYDSNTLSYEQNQIFSSIPYGALEYMRAFVGLFTQFSFDNDATRRERFISNNIGFNMRFYMKQHGQDVMISHLNAKTEGLELPCDYVKPLDIFNHIYVYDPEPNNV